MKHPYQHDIEKVYRRTDDGDGVAYNLIKRPPEITDNIVWNVLAARICEALNVATAEMRSRYEAADSANISLYSGLWRYGLPEVPRDRMTLQAFINAVTAHFARRARPPTLGDKLKPSFSAHQLHAELDAKRIQHNMTWKDIGARTGVNTTTMSKMKDNKNCPNIEACLALCKWLEVDPNRYLFMVAK